ncbi:MAG: patatin-like phospholipase family protein [Pseudomonadota bacterium]
MSSTPPREPPRFAARPEIRRLALTLQGGGALGAYQAGVYQALEEHGFEPGWVAGTSIGAINGALIAGNPPGARTAKLRAFWERVADRSLTAAGDSPALRPWVGAFAAWNAILAGRPGFFSPRYAPAACGAPEALSYYDTAPLREALAELVDFGRLNAGAPRFSVGAVHVASGRLRYFDSRYQRIGPEHVLASGALPPGFPAVRVDDELYWDGGIYSNTPLEIVLDDHPRVSTLCVMVDLFDPAGPEPGSLAEVMARRKNIAYASRSRQHLEDYAKVHNLRRAVQALYARLSPELQQDPQVRRLAGLGCQTTMEIVHLGYADGAWELETKDIDFSWAAIRARWGKGYADACRMIERAPWREPLPAGVGAVVHEFPREPDEERSMP